MFSIGCQKRMRNLAATDKLNQTSNRRFNREDSACIVVVTVARPFKRNSLCSSSVSQLEWLQVICIDGAFSFIA